MLDELTFLMKCGDGLEFQTLLEEELLQRGIVRSLEIIGEASKNVSDDLKAEHPEIEWKLIAGMRDKLIHHYFNVNWRIVWDVLIREVPIC